MNICIFLLSISIIMINISILELNKRVYELERDLDLSNLHKKKGSEEE